MASGLLIKQKQLLAGDGIAINHGETASTISLAENALDNSVRIYDATVDAETGVITITDGTQVSDLAIGDEIRTPDGVYQKIKDNITTTGPADGSRIEVSGITSPADANGYYALQSEDVWKHETANYWITVYSSFGYYWMISSKSDPANPGEALFYDMTGAGDPGNPWDLTNWQSSSGGASGTPVLENVASEQTVTDTIDLFEYASLPVEPENIVQSVNGNKPDASGNVTIETGSSIDESRLLPEAPDNGDVPVFNATATTGGGNDETTKFLLQPLAGESSIVDTAAGTPAPVAITVNGTVEIGAEGGIQFDGSYGADSSITIPANALPSEIFDGEHDFTIDIVYTADSSATGRQCLFGKGDPPGRFDFLLDKNGDLSNGSGPSLGSGWPFDVKVRLTVEVYKQGDSWNYTCFRDGAVITSGTWANDVAWRQNPQPIGYDGSYRWFKGTIWAFRITAGAPHKGQAFMPDPLPWTEPQVVGAWENQNLNESIDVKIATHNADSTAHPDKLPLSGGQMTGELKINTTNAVRINNGDYGVILRKDASSFYIMVTAQGDPNGGYTEARPLKIDLATGECSINGGAFKDSNGNVITTTYAPLSHPTFSNGVEITGTTPYIDFHYNNSESDFTFRIVQSSEDTLTLGGKVVVSNTLTVGGMSVNGNIKNVGEIQSETTNSYRLVYGNYGTFWRNDGNNLYLMLTDSGDQYGLYNSLRPLTVDLATGDCTITGNAVGTESKLSSAGVYPRVSMNTTATADFNTFKAQGNYWFAFGVRPNGPLGDTAETTGVLSVYNIQNTHTLQVYNMYSATGASTQQMYYRWCYNGTWTSWFKALTNDDVKHVVGATNTNVKQNDYIIIANTLIIYFGYTWVDKAGSVTVYLPITSSSAVSAVATCTNPQTSAITNLKCYTQQSSIEIVIDSTTTTTQTTVNWIAIGYLA